jgi:hypothetical protein
VDPKPSSSSDVNKEIRRTDVNLKRRSILLPGTVNCSRMRVPARPKLYVIQSPTPQLSSIATPAEQATEEIEKKEKEPQQDLGRSDLWKNLESLRPESWAHSSVEGESSAKAVQVSDQVSKWLRRPEIEKEEPMSVRERPCSELLEGKAGSGLASLFDELKDMNYTALGAHPINATYHCRRLVLAKTAIAVDAAVSETLSLTFRAMTNLQTITKFDFEKFDKNAWNDEWRGEFFTQLWELREEVELLGYRMNNNMRVLKKV